MVNGNMMEIKDLIPTHNSLRRPEKLQELIDFFLAGHVLRCMPCHLNQTEDHKIYIHNGHHRAVAMFKSGIRVLYPGEYFITYKTYQDYNSINRNVGYVTPFDLKTQVRNADFLPLRKQLAKLDDEGIRQYINIYTEPRTIFTLKELCLKY